MKPIFPINILLTAVWLSVSLTSYGQENDEKIKLPYLFEDFSPASILFKTGKLQDAKFNYNVATEEMVYMKNKKFMALEMQGIDTIFINNRKFIPAGTAFFEVLPVNSGILYIRHYYKIRDKGRPIGYGSHSQTSATTSVTNISAGGTLYNLELPSEVTIQNNSQVWIKKSESVQMHEFHNLKHAQRVFPDQKSEIKDFVKNNKTDFNQVDDVLRLLQILD